ncbi:helix-turn-helix domain-containing protein [Pyxidicoccus sp. 3LG]
MSQSGSSAEGARVRWLVAGAFSPSPTGRRFHVTSESFASELARAATGLRATVADRLGASDTRTVELSFERLRSFGLADLVTSVPELRALHSLHEELSRSDPLRTLSPEEAATRVATITGPGRLPDAIAEALREASGKKVRAAELLGISRPTLDKKIEEYGLAVERGRRG